jgi:hypothetical protein
VAALLRDRRIPFAIVGAAAMAVHGVARSTRDLDLLVLTRRCLDAATWAPLRESGVEVQIRPGDVDDPLAGVIRLLAPDTYPLDVVVGRHPWQEAILARARDTEIEGVRVPVADPTGLTLLKLYAGGPQDLWDITQLLAGPGRSALIAEVEASLDALPPGCRSLWTRVLTLASA